jgi:hypothetical protein
MTPIERLPAYAADLVRALDAAYPHKCIAKEETLRDADRYAGKREVVEFLLRLLADSQNNITDVPHVHQDP